MQRIKEGVMTERTTTILENNTTDEEIPRRSEEHGNLVEYRFDAYHDVKVYEDGYVESFYIGD